MEVVSTPGVGGASLHGLQPQPPLLGQLHLSEDIVHRVAAEHRSVEGLYLLQRDRFHRPAGTLHRIDAPPDPLLCPFERREDLRGDPRTVARFNSAEPTGGLGYMRAFDASGRKVVSEVYDFMLDGGMIHSGIHCPWD